MTTTLNDMPAKKKPVRSAEEVAAKGLVRLAQEQGLSPTGPTRLLKQFTKSVRKTAQEMTEHLGHEKNRAAGGRDSSNVRKRNPVEDGAHVRHWAGRSQGAPGP